MSLFVGNVSRQVTEEELLSLFSKHGPCKIDLKTSFAFVEFEKEEHAAVAVEKVHGIKIAGLYINVEWSKKSNHFDAERRQQHRRREDWYPTLFGSRSEAKNDSIEPQQTSTPQEACQNENSYPPDHYRLPPHHAPSIPPPYSHPPHRQFEHIPLHQQHYHMRMPGYMPPMLPPPASIEGRMPEREPIAWMSVPVGHPPPSRPVLRPYDNSGELIVRRLAQYPPRHRHHDQRSPNYIVEDHLDHQRILHNGEPFLSRDNSDVSPHHDPYYCDWVDSKAPDSTGSSSRQMTPSSYRHMVPNDDRHYYHHRESEMYHHHRVRELSVNERRPSCDRCYSHTSPPSRYELPSIVDGHHYTDPHDERRKFPRHHHEETIRHLDCPLPSPYNSHPVQIRSSRYERLSPYRQNNGDDRVVCYGDHIRGMSPRPYSIERRYGNDRRFYEKNYPVEYNPTQIRESMIMPSGSNPPTDRTIIRRQNRHFTEISNHAALSPYRRMGVDDGMWQRHSPRRINTHSRSGPRDLASSIGDPTVPLRETIHSKGERRNSHTNNSERRALRDERSISEGQVDQLHHSTQTAMHTNHELQHSTSQCSPSAATISPQEDISHSCNTKRKSCSTESLSPRKDVRHHRRPSMSQQTEIKKRRDEKWETMNLNDKSSYHETEERGEEITVNVVYLEEHCLTTTSTSNKLSRHQSQLGSHVELKEVD